MLGNSASIYYKCVCGQDLWIATVKSQLREKEVPRDVTEAEALLKKHQDLKSDISANATK